MPIIAGIMLLGFAGMALAGTALAGAAAADDNPGGGGIGIAVTVAPAASDTASPASSASAEPGFATNSDTVPSAGPSPEVSAAAVTGSSDLGQPIFASGLSSHYVWSADPTSSSAILGITVKNYSTSTFTSSVTYWIDTPVGVQVGKTIALKLTNLKPGESRLIEAEIVGLGQWTVMNAHVELTPPALIDGQVVKPIRRDSFIVVPPIAAGGVSLALVMGFVAFKFVSFSRAAALLKLVT